MLFWLVIKLFQGVSRGLLGCSEWLLRVLRCVVLSRGCYVVLVGY